MTDPGWLSIFPPLLAIVLAIWSKQVILSLFAGIWMGYFILHGFNPVTGIAAGLDGVINVFGDPGDTRVLLFTLLIGSLIATIEESGGVRGFVHFLESRRYVHNRVRAQMLAWVTGLVIFIESNITLLVAGAVSRPLFDRYRISREKLAYLIDATSAPVCVMIPLNAWGAVIISLIASTGIDNPLQTFIAAIPYNLYAIVAIILSAVVIWKNINLGPMKAAEERTQKGELLWPGAMPLVDVSAEQEPVDDGRPVPPAYLMMLPILAMILMMPVGLYITGDGNLIEGSGSESILWAISFALVVAWTLMLSHRLSNINDLMRVFMKGAGALLPIATILLLALALGDVANLLGTGPYVAGVVGAAVAEPLLAPLHIPRIRVHRVLGRIELGHLRHHDPDRDPDRNHAGPAGAAAAGRRDLRRHLRRSLLADQRHDRRRVDGLGHRSHRSRADAVALRPARRGDCGHRIPVTRIVCLTCCREGSRTFTNGTDSTAEV
ncbi:MAG: Na+/H+ antiporter NhaC family protein [Woeseiaceae bacterium]|nr:Na+/H+ antiporter NhaC family protein [Woeseiaceae bacterium]